MERLEGRVAVVTGAASGIGLAVVEAFAELGVRVVMADVDGESLRAQATRLSDGGAQIHAVTVDVRDPDEVERVAAEAVERFGTLNIAVNNAGVVNGGYSWELPLEDWHRVIDIDLWGVINCTRAYLPLLKAQPEASLTNVSSAAGLAGLLGNPAYFAAKFGVRGFTESMRSELRRTGVKVTCVFPGVVKTNLGGKPSRLSALPGSDQPPYRHAAGAALRGASSIGREVSS